MPAGKKSVLCSGAQRIKFFPQYELQPQFKSDKKKPQQVGH